MSLIPVPEPVAQIIGNLESLYVLRAEGLAAAVNETLKAAYLSEGDERRAHIVTAQRQIADLGSALLRLALAGSVQTEAGKCA